MRPVIEGDLVEQRRRAVNATDERAEVQAAQRRQAATIVRRPAGFAFIALIVTAGWFTSGCGLMDFLGSFDGEAPPSATARPASNVSRTQPPSVPTPAVAIGEPASRPTRTPTATPTPTPIPPEVQFLNDLSAEWARTSTVHFELDVDGKTYLDDRETIELRSAEGDLKRPNQTAASAKVQIGFASFTVKLVVIGDEAYTTNVLNGDWERAPASFDFNPALLFDTRRGVGAVLEDLRAPELAGHETIDGRDAEILTGYVTANDIEDLVAGSLTGDRIEVTVWMDRATDQFLRISLAEPDSEDDPTTWTIDFSAHNEPLTITAPDL
jgi:hypothetical protein